MGSSPYHLALPPDLEITRTVADLPIRPVLDPWAQVLYSLNIINTTTPQGTLAVPMPTHQTSDEGNLAWHIDTFLTSPTQYQNYLQCSRSQPTQTRTRPSPPQSTILSTWTGTSQGTNVSAIDNTASCPQDKPPPYRRPIQVMTKW